MRVLVVGGTGVIGAGLIPTLLVEGYQVRLASRGAARDVRQWDKRVEPFTADVTDPRALRGAADGCDAVVHITGVVDESPPEITYESVNVEGTRNVAAEARRARVRRFVYISSLGADRGRSEYHRTKLEGERVVRETVAGWVILRPGNVYGPGDDAISTLLMMVRTMPVVPVIDLGTHRFQPIWYEDLALAIARSLTMPQLGGEVLEIAGHEITTTLNVLDRMEEITGRNVLRFPIPSTLASAATQVADALSIELPISEAKLTMLLEENFIRDPGANAITRIFGIMPTDLDTGLRALADALPEQLPSDGVGELQRKRYWADIEGSALTAEAVMECFRSEIVSIVPIDFAAEPGASTKLEAGSTLTAAIPGRGHIQVRVEDSSPTHVTFATIEGHPLAGAIRFSTCSSGGAIRFQVMVYARAANPVDWAMMNSIGSPLQDAVWTSVVEEVVKRSGGTAPDGVEHDTASFVGNAARDVEEWARRVVMNGGR